MAELFNRISTALRSKAWVARRPEDDQLGWRALPPFAQLYASSVMFAGVCALAAFFPREWPSPIVIAALLACSCLTASWKVNLPITLVSGSTLSMSHAANVMALLIVGPGVAILIAVAGAWTQCTFNVRRAYPWYRTAFSMAGEALSVAASGLVYLSLGGAVPPTDVFALPTPLVAAIATYFLVNSALVAGAIALSVRQPVWKVWHDDFLWSAPSFLVAGALGGIAAVAVVHSWQWAALLIFAPLYLTYRTYRVFLSRLDEQRRHVEETQLLHEHAVDALQQARRAEQALAAEKERLAVTLRSIADGLITTDLDGTILSINRVAEELTGWTQENAIGEPLATVFRNFDPETRERCDNSVQTLAARTTERRGVRCSILFGRDLAEHPIEESVAAICAADGRAIGMLLAFRDITDALRIQEERAKASRMASLGLLAGGIARDFNNALLAIMGNVSIARASIPKRDPVATALADAEQACLNARQLTWQLLTFSKGGVPRKQAVGLATVLKESASVVLRGSNVDCLVECPPNLWPVEADPDQLADVFSRVLTNAQQAMPHGGVIAVTAENVHEVTARSGYALSISPGPHVRVSISDKGIGIPKENLGRIFDPYFSTKQRGSGLGLATTHSVVKNHGGFLSVDSQLGVGTTVHVTLPAMTALALPEPVLPVRSSGGGRPRVLVMDDEEAIRRLAVTMLECLGYDGEIVDGGNAAVERFTRALQQGHPFDVVILDLIVRGGVGGKEAVAQLAAIDPSVKAIVMSGYAQDSTMTDYRDHGFQAAISKPFTLQELSATLQFVVGGPTCRVQ
jgi:PAS domain S-box-containing protein